MRMVGGCGSPGVKIRDEIAYLPGLKRKPLTHLEGSAVRITRFRLCLLGLITLVLVGPVALTQGPGAGGVGGPGGPGGGRGGRGRGGMDPDAFFNMLSGGKDSISVSEVQSPEWMSRFMPTEQLRQRMSDFLKK